MSARRDFLFVGCEAGHDWKSVGGCNAGCHRECTCSVPVHECSRCGDSDYGETEQAVQTRAACADQWGPPGERLGPAPIPVVHPYYPTRCEHCGWRGSSEQCGTINYGDDADVTCPGCLRIFMAEEYAVDHSLLSKT